MVTDNEDIENRKRRVEELLQAIDIADEGGDDSQADELEEEAATLIGEIEELEAIAAEEEEEYDEEEDDEEEDEGDEDDEDDEAQGVAREAAIRQAIEEEAYFAEMAYIEEEEIRLEEEAAAEEEEAARAEEEGAGGGIDPDELHKQVLEGFQKQYPSPAEMEKESLQKYHRALDRMTQDIRRKVR